VANLLTVRIRTSSLRMKARAWIDDSAVAIQLMVNPMKMS
jgi:hypothetical protein